MGGPRFLPPKLLLPLPRADARSFPAVLMAPPPSPLAMPPPSPLSNLPLGSVCTAASECASGMCASSTVGRRLTLEGRRLTHEGGTVCVLADGAACVTYMDCASGYCDYGTYLCGTAPPPLALSLIHI